MCQDDSALVSIERQQPVILQSHNLQPYATNYISVSHINEVRPNPKHPQLVGYKV